jgi:pimeloyl-ACP methyl ester carboxylesterase
MTITGKRIEVNGLAQLSRIAPDLRRFGETSVAPNKAGYHIDGLVAELIGILDAPEVDKVRLVGHDRGSAICRHTCLRHRDRIDRYAALSVGHPGAYAHAASSRSSSRTTSVLLDSLALGEVGRLPLTGGFGAG